MTLSFMHHAVYIEISGHISTLHVRHRALSIVGVCELMCLPPQHHLLQLYR